MARLWNINDLNSGHFDRAYALLQLLDDGRTASDWKDEIEAWRVHEKGQQSGVACITDEQDYILSLCFYSVSDGTTCGRALEIDRIIMPDTLAPMVSYNLAILFDEFARQKNCDAVHVGIVDNREADQEATNVVIGTALKSDFQFSAAHWCRRIEA